MKKKLTGKQRKKVVGLDLGGTFIKVGLLDTHGRIIKKNQLPTLAEKRSRQIVLEQMKKAIDSVLEPDFSLLGIGIGTPGLVDNQGRVFEAPNLPAWHNFSLQEYFERIYHVPVSVENDVNSITWGEYLLGAGKNSRTMICITLGTGLGGGVVINGKLLRGAVFSAAELGHVTIDYHGPVCNCGNIGCIERFVSRDAIVERAINAIQAGRKTVLYQLCEGQIANITPRMISEAANQGDLLSREIWQDVGKCLGFFFVGLINIFNPDVVVIGGGIARAGKLLFAPIRQIVKQHAMKKLASHVRFVPAGLGNDTGIISAAALVLGEKLASNNS